MKEIIFKLYNLITFKKGVWITVDFYQLYSNVNIKNVFSNKNYHQVQLSFFCLFFDLYRSSNPLIKKELKSNLELFFSDDFEFVIEKEPLVELFSSYSPVIHESYWSQYYLTFSDKEKLIITDSFKGNQVKTGSMLFDAFALSPLYNMNFSNPVHYLSRKMEYGDFPKLKSFHFLYSLNKNNKLETSNLLGSQSKILHPFCVSIVLNKIYSCFSESEVADFKVKGRFFLKNVDVICAGPIERIITELNLKV